MITYYFRAIKDAKLETLSESRTGVWVHAVSPTDDEIEKLVTEYGLDSSILNDSRDFFEVPRFERSGNATYFFTRYPYAESEEATDTAPILIVMGESFVLTVTLIKTPFLEYFLSGKKECFTTQKAKLFLELMTALFEDYNRELTHMRRVVHRNRAELRSIHNRDIERLVRYENTLNDIVSALVPTNTWLSQVLTGNYLQLFKEDIALVEDLTITNNQLVDSAKSILKTIQNIRGAYESILTNNLNMTIRMLAALTIILTIPTTIASLFGMNVAIPLGAHPHAFWLVIVLIVAVMALVIHYFARKRWL